MKILSSSIFLFLTACGCDDSYSTAVLRNLPGAYGECDTFVCPKKEKAVRLSYVKYLRETGAKQPDACVQKAYYGWADYYERKAVRDYASWLKELHSRELEKLIKK